MLNNGLYEFFQNFDFLGPFVTSEVCRLNLKSCHLRAKIWFPKQESLQLSSSQEQSYCSDEDKRSDVTTSEPASVSNNVRTVKFSDLDTVHEDDSSC